MRRTVIRNLLLFLLLSISLCSCNNDRLDIEEVEGLWLPSIKEIYPMIEAKAKELDPETKLQKLFISLFPENQKADFVIMARYDHIKDNEAIYVYYYLDGTIIGEVKEMGLTDIAMKEFEKLDKQMGGIEFDETIMDSPEAFSILKEYADLSSTYRDRIYCSDLILSKYDNPDFDPVIWVLFLRECEGDFVRQIEIDARTGELIALE